MIEIIITEKEQNIRLDLFLSFKLNISRNQCHFLINSGLVLVNKKKIKKSYLLKNNDLLNIYQKEVIDNNFIEPVNLKLDIVYEDEYLAIINKPYGLIVHPSPSYSGITLINGLFYQIKSLRKLSGNRPGIVHRLDKDTTGLIIIGKTEEVIIKLQKLIQKRKIKRIYFALIHGFLADKGKIELPIKRDCNNRLKMSVSSNGKPSITYFKTLKKFNDFSLLEIQLETGRTHQIRVHFSFLKHPILGDILYGKKYKEKTRQLLHAKKLFFKHPITNINLQFEIPLPSHFKDFLEFLELRKK
ncbi:RluA family pseudouridine synthase [Texas Phoenix palm phytoplasma]|uniref:Pseudouridine synthase n=1 Tax=Texas Phoenix palm phytoplasma TaxID=176709 RepID=A0ABS5BI04_9MOLU|nr:RluA family pseudouridine synthase [Texas Phoenix palm phytoplasma]MBP3059213.1 RluA family pseudouridine synthase [Texas Phoenix palm phytoplasma]